MNTETNEMKTHSRIEDTVSVADLREDLAALRHDVSQLVAHGAQSAKEGAAEGLHSVTEHAKEGHERLGHYVSERPITSLAIAAGVGALVAKLITR